MMEIQLEFLTIKLVHKEMETWTEHQKLKSANFIRRNRIHFCLTSEEFADNQYDYDNRHLQEKSLTGLSLKLCHLENFEMVYE